MKFRGFAVDVDPLAGKIADWIFAIEAWIR